jgi:hypothetical protein
MASGPGKYRARGGIRAGRLAAAYTAGMQEMLSGGLVVAVFLAVAAIALLVLVRLFRISGTGRAKAGPGA